MKQFKFFSKRYCYIIDGVEIPEFIDREEFRRAYFHGWNQHERGITYTVYNNFWDHLTIDERAHYELGWENYGIFYNETYNVL